MTATVPRWLIVVLLGVLALVLAVGLSVQSTRWAATHPFTLSLLSSLGGFAASGTFAALVFNRLARRRYWPAELDARSTTARDADFLLRDSLSLFGQSLATGPPEAILGRLLGELDSDDGSNATEIHAEVFPSIEGGLADLANVESRFSFLDDPDLIYRASRLRRKGTNFVREWSALQQPVNHRREAAPVALVEAAIEMVEATADLRSWAHSAPDQRMRDAVTDRAFRSDLD